MGVVTEPHDPASPLFSLRVTSGFLFRIETRLRFERLAQALQRQAPRAALYLFIAWVAPMLLALFEPARHGAISFLSDFETHLRSLVAIPLLLFAEGRVDPAVGYVVRSLASPRRCRRPDELERRVRALQTLVAHPLAPVVLLGLSLFVVPAWIRQHTSGRETWIFRVLEGRPELTAAGTWQAFVVVPVYVFLLLRWFWRWFVLAIVFARSAPLLRPVVTHADRCGGFSFVSDASAQFGWVIAGISSLVSARWLFAILREGAPATAFAKPALAIVVLSLLLAFAPLLAFVVHFMRAKRSGLRRYRAIVEGHAQTVEREWYRRPFPGRVTSEESSSLADLNTVYEAIRVMRLIPFRRRHVAVIVFAALVPMLPVLSLIAPIHDVLRQVFKALL